MAAFQYRFERLQKVNESEKKQLEQIYRELFQLLEDQGRRLIELMEKKEILVKQFEERKQQKVSVFHVREQLNVLDAIGAKILAEQEKYESLRDRLEAFKKSLMDKSIELKKYEKLRDIHFDQYSSVMKRVEDQQMDEAALHQTYRH